MLVLKPRYQATKGWDPASGLGRLLFSVSLIQLTGPEPVPTPPPPVPTPTPTPVPNPVPPPGGAPMAAGPVQTLFDAFMDSQITAATMSWYKAALQWIKDEGDKFFSAHPMFKSAVVQSRSVVTDAVDAFFAFLETQESGHPFLVLSLVAINKAIDAFLVSKGL